MNRIAFAFICLALVAPALVAQGVNLPLDLPYGLQFQRSNIHNGNRVKTTFFNQGRVTGGEGSFPNGAWPVENNTYIGDLNVVVGIERVFQDTILFTAADPSRRTGRRLRDGRVGVRIPPNAIIDSNIVVGNERGVAVSDTSWFVTGNPSVRFRRTEKNPGGTFYGLTPFSGFFNIRQDRIAMSHLPETWPDRWPDQPTWIEPNTGRSEWNGYFGRGITNADQESYFVTTDGTDRQWFDTYGFLPYPNDTRRYGAGLVMSVRGLQFSNFLAQDNIFWIYDIKNDSRFDYDKVFFGSIVGTNIGGTPAAGGISFFDQSRSITYSRATSPSNVAGNWDLRFPPGLLGLAFLESPGNPFDGIDNDGDFRNVGRNTTAMPPQFNLNGGTGPYDYDPATRTPNAETGRDDFFFRRVLRAGDPIIVIERARRAVPFYNSEITVYNRRYLTVPNRDTVVVSLGRRYTVGPNRTLTEVPNNTFDDNLNGIIDENYELHVDRRVTAFDLITQRSEARSLPPLHYIDYIQLGRDNPTGLPAGSGILDPIVINQTLYPMIDERRDDAFDNNGNEDGSGLFLDARDVNEADQIGLTSFAFGTNNDFDLGNIPEMVRSTRPGRFDLIPANILDGDYMYGAGYFPLGAGQTERFSIAQVYGTDELNILSNRDIVQAIYDANYNFARPPQPVPRVRAYTDKDRVTLYWDSASEDYRDEFIRRRLDLPQATSDPRVRNFEGYKIYKATDANFSDALVITDSRGQPAQQLRPIAQFDLDNDIRGNFPLSSRALLEQSRGIAYFLGNNTGLSRTFTDSNVVNGKTYFYAVVSYNRGDTALGLYPSENPVSARPDGRGNFLLGQNVVVVTPGAKVGGYENPTGNSGNLEPVLRNGRPPVGDGRVRFTTLNPNEVRDRDYIVEFLDTSNDGIDNNRDGRIDERDGRELSKITTSFRVIDVTNAARPDTIIRRSTLPLSDQRSYRRNTTTYIADDQIFNGILLSIDNDINIRFDAARSGWQRSATAPAPNTYTVNLTQVNPGTFETAAAVFDTVAQANDFEIEIVANASSNAVNFRRGDAIRNIPAQPCNFVVRNLTTGQPTRFFFPVNSQNTRLDTNLVQIALPFSPTPLADGTDTLYSWVINFIPTRLSPQVRPRVGDKYVVRLVKPFASGDQFRLQARAVSVSNDAAKSNLDRVKVVPNPYVARSLFESALPTGVQTGRGERVITFTNVPQNAVIRIYTVRGDFVTELRQNGSLEGTVRWDLRTRDGLDAAYGLYLYHLDAPGVGTKTGKFALIK